jgi:tRNA A-37 threonylcarbamoyl transferase component Bud32
MKVVLKLQKNDDVHRNEIAVLKKIKQKCKNLKCNNFVPLFIDSYEVGNKGYILVEYMAGDILFDLYAGDNRNKNVPNAMIKKVVDAFIRLSKMGICHTDGHLGNLISVKNKVGFIDFGLSKIIKPGSIEHLRKDLRKFKSTMFKDGITEKEYQQLSNYLDKVVNSKVPGFGKVGEKNENKGNRRITSAKHNNHNNSSSPLKKQRKRTKNYGGLGKENQCKGKTKKGKRCKRKTMDKFCYQHS